MLLEAHSKMLCFLDHSLEEHQPVCQYLCQHDDRKSTLRHLNIVLVMITTQIAPPVLAFLTTHHDTLDSRKKDTHRHTRTCTRTLTRRHTHTMCILLLLFLRWTCTVLARVGFSFSCFVFLRYSYQPDTPEEREPQLRNCLHLISLWVWPEGTFIDC